MAPEKFGGTESMAIEFHGDGRGEVNFLAPFATKPHISFVVPSNFSEFFVRMFL